MTTLVSLEAGEIQAMKKDVNAAGKHPVDAVVAEADPATFDGLLLPGGTTNPDKLRLDEKAVAFVKAFVTAGKPIAAICHGPWMLINAEGVRGKTLTSWPSLQTDLRNAGATWVDQEVATGRQARHDRECLAKAGLHHRPVRKPGQAIAVGHVDQHVLRRLALGHVADDGAESDLPVLGPARERELQRLDLRVRGECFDLLSETHAAVEHRREVAGGVPGPFGQQVPCFEREEFFFRVAEEALRLPVDEEDAPVAIDDQHGVGRHRRHLLEARLAGPALAFERAEFQGLGRGVRVSPKLPPTS